MIRSLIETYLTVYYLNFECRDHEECQKFRNDLYKYSGLARRQEFKPQQEEGIAKLALEAIELMGLKQAIEANPYYHTLTTDKKNKIWKDKIAREYSWFDMIQGRGILSMDFLSMWKLLSNHAHAEYIGVMQLNSYYKNPEEHKPGIYNLASMGLMLSALLIHDYTTTFNAAEIVYNTQPETLRAKVALFQRILLSKSKPRV